MARQIHKHRIMVKGQEISIPIRFDDLHLTFEANYLGGKTSESVRDLCDKLDAVAVAANGELVDVIEVIVGTVRGVPRPHRVTAMRAVLDDEGKCYARVIESKDGSDDVHFGASRHAVYTPATDALVEAIGRYEGLVEAMEIKRSELDDKLRAARAQLCTTDFVGDFQRAADQLRSLLPLLL